MKSLIKLWRYIKSNLANYNIFNCKIHLLEKIIFWFFAIFWLFAIFFILYNLQFEFMMLYEYEEDFNKYVKIIKGAKDTIKNAILNVSSNSNGLSNNINGVTNPDVDNSDINAAIEYLIANTNFTFNDIIAVSEAVGSLELGVSILTAGGIVGGVVITPGFNISGTLFFHLKTTSVVIRAHLTYIIYIWRSIRSLLVYKQFWLSDLDPR